MNHEIKVLEYVIGGEATLSEISKNTRIPEVTLKSVLKSLESKKFVKVEEGVVSITEEGKKYLIEMKKL